MITEKQVGEFKLLCFTGADAVELHDDPSTPAPKQLYTWKHSRGADGLTWETLEQFWGDYGMVVLGLDLRGMAGVAKNLYEGNKTDPVDVAEELGLDPGDVDSLVQDLKSKDASAINNGGFFDQMDYLIEELGHEETVKEIRRIAEEKKTVG